MNNFNKLSIVYVLPTILFAMFFFFQGTIFFFEYQHEQQKLYSEKEQYVKGITGNLQTRLSNSLMRLEKAQAQNIVSEMVLDQNIKSIAVVDHNQQIVLSNQLRDKYMFAKLQLDHYDGTLLKQVIEKNEFIFQYNQQTQDLIVYAPLQMLSKGNSLNRKFNGLIFIRYSLTRAITELRYEALFSLIRITFTMLVSLLFLIYMLNKLIIRPLQQLTQSTSLANLTEAPIQGEHGVGEIGALQHAFTKLAQDVNGCIDKHAGNEQRLLYALSGAKDGVWDWNIAQDSVYYSERWKEMVGHHKDEISDSIEEWESRLHADDLFLVMQELNQHFTGKSSFFESIHRLRCHTGEYRWVLSRGQTVSWDENGSPLRIIGTNTDVSNYIQSQHRLNYQTQFDEVTQLPNRNQLLSTIENECERSKHTNLHGAIVFIECDEYKTLNELEGHYKGDNLLFAIARRIEELMKGRDFLAHLIGSKFAIIVPDLHLNRDSSAKLALDFTNNLNAALQKPFLIEEDNVFLSCAFGIELFPLATRNANDLLRQATMALKFSEDNNVNHISFFAKEIEQKIHARHQLQQQIHYGLEHQEYTLHFQPRVNADGQLIGAETLIRWIHCNEGPVSPAEFIPIAEECGLIFKMGDWVIRSSFEQLVEWQKRGLPDNFTTLSLNVSTKQLLDEHFVSSIEAHLYQTGVNPELIEIEITETILLSHKELVIEKLNKLRTLGLCFAIDDFGTGYSSFSYLSVLPVSTLKLDQSFIKNITNSTTQQVIVSNIIRLADELNLEVVAEGIESEAQLSLLIEKGCTQFQGYFMAKPMHKEAFEKLLFAP